ncbi:trigger factor [Candidatus Nitronereus thalassa]|uniref:Trigger factor n=1 Tax=Candidatus Nitronereus thalassa TaxID=3020898 RepID=A0ABU3K896_9BACT|nr:trigger factor [Candidatus Nitronereus thalassa]MDT7042615.1 trigger factor [Candidatus Nitronereus thalassa]
MKLEVTELGPVKRAIKIEVPEDAVNKEFDRVYTDLKRQVRIPGFRPGKAPLAMLEKRYAKAAEQDVIQRLVPDYYHRAMREADVSPVLVEIPPLERMKAQRNATLTFTATVEIKPKIELRDYRPPNPISLKPDPRTVSDEDVDKALENLRQSQARIDAAPAETTLDEGLLAVVNIEGFLDGEPVEGSKKDGHLHNVGSNEPVLGIKIDEALMGKTEGQTAEVIQEYPATHPDERLAGKSVTFRLSIIGVKQKIIPALDDEFAKDCGPYETVQALKDKVRTELENSLKRTIEEAHKDQIIERLVEMHHFDLPEVLVDREVKAMVRQRLMEEQRKKGGSHPPDDQSFWEAEVKRLQQDLAPDAKKRVKLALILEAIADKEGVSISEEEIQEEITKLAHSLQIPVENIQEMIKSGGESSRQEFQDRLRSEKALQLVYQFAVIQG